MSSYFYNLMVLVQPLKFRQTFVSKISTTANVKFSILPVQCCGNNFADDYGKMQLFALAATWTRLNIHLDKHLKLNTWTGLAWDDKCKPQHIPTVCITEGK